MIYFQILTKPCRTPLIKELLLLNASLFSYARTQKKCIFLEKLTWKKMQKNFIVNNNYKIILAWYLSSKWPVCRPIVNQINGGAGRAKFSTLLKTNIFKYCTLFCNKVVNIHLHQRNSFNSNNRQMNSCPFSELFPF